MDAKLIRWGILSAANIARKNWKAIRNSGNGTVVAVASRELPRAQQFINECQAHTPMGNDVKAFASYDELLASSEIDAVYIPLPTGLRKEWVLRAAAAGKHVLCEKPCAVSLADLREMTDPAAAIAFNSWTASCSCIPHASRKSSNSSNRTASAR